MTEGELSFIYIGGELSHALVKRPAKGDFRAHGIYGGTVELATPTDADAAEATRSSTAWGSTSSTPVSTRCASTASSPSWSSSSSSRCCTSASPPAAHSASRRLVARL